MRRVVHRREIELGFQAGLLEVLLGEGRHGINPSSGLHGLGLLLAGSRLLLFLVDPALDRPLVAGGRYGLFWNEGADATSAARLLLAMEISCLGWLQTKTPGAARTFRCLAVAGGK